MSAAPSYCTKLLWVVVSLVDEVNLIEYFLRLLQADTMLRFCFPAFARTELEPHEPIYRV